MMNNFFLVIPTRNRLDYLSNLLVDLNAFKNNISQVIIIDQSTDDISQEIIKLNLEYHYVFEINDRKNSVNNSRNQALKHYQDEEWLFFLDDDLRIPAIAFDKILKHLEPNVIDVLIPGIVFDGIDNEVKHHTILDTIAKPNNFAKPRFRLQVCSGLNIVKSTIFEKIGFNFDENFTIWGDDWDYGMRLLNAGANIYFQPDILVEHLHGQVGGQREKLNSLNIYFEKQKLYFYFYKKHFSRSVLKQVYFFSVIESVKYFLKTASVLKIYYNIKAFKRAKKM
ncbi:MAG: glycosyltransferase family 2 protein [Flavobacterium sp.]|nr:glycosyltransferase family 2 protein [Flavobacterium sp.]